MLNEKSNLLQKFSDHLAHFVFSEGQCYVVQSDFVLSEENVTQLSQSNENASLTSLHTSYICCAVKPLGYVKK